jgi:hypothetical protein
MAEEPLDDVVRRDPPRELRWGLVAHVLPPQPEPPQAGGRDHLDVPEAAMTPDEPFMVSRGAVLELGAPHTLGRPALDRSYAVLASGPEGSWLVARRRSRPRSGKPPAALVRLGRSGDVIAERTIDHEVHRTGAAARRRGSRSWLNWACSGSTTTA